MTDSNCPNCGAPAKGLACEYCGTPLASPDKAISLAVGKTVSISFEHEGRLYEFDIEVEQVSISVDADPFSLRDWNGDVVSTIFNPTYGAMFNGRLVPSEKHGRKGMWFYRELAPDEMTC